MAIKKLLEGRKCVYETKIKCSDLWWRVLILDDESIMIFEEKDFREGYVFNLNLTEWSVEMEEKILKIFRRWKKRQGG